MSESNASDLRELIVPLAWEALGLVVRERDYPQNGFRASSLADTPPLQPYFQNTNLHGLSQPPAASVLFDVVWDWACQGITRPRLLTHDPGNHSYFLTEYGRHCLAGEDLENTPYDPDRYLEVITGRAGQLDSVVRSFLTEALKCFHMRTYLAAMVMLGAASERALYLLAGAYLPPEKVGGKVSDLFKRTQGALGGKTTPGFREALSKDVRDDWSPMLESGFHIIRISRNEAGHPHLTRTVSRAEARERFILFSTYLEVVSGLIALADRFRE